MAKNHVLAVVFVGGEGKRLMSLTDDHVEPTAPFGGHFHLIDFALPNIVNSGYLKIVVLTQHKSHSLSRHATKTWYTSPLLDNFIAPVPAQRCRDPYWYLGSADAIYQSLNVVDDEQSEHVVIIGAGNIYRMDFSQMIQHHIDSGLPAAVAGIRRLIELTSVFGVIGDKNGVVKNFFEKSKDAVGPPDDPTKVLAPVGNYVFTTKDLVNILQEDAIDPDSRYDIGGNVIPQFVEHGECGMYDFQDNDVSGSTDHDHGHWCDVGTPDAYYETSMDLISVHPVFSLYNRDWPTMTMADGSPPPAKFVYGGVDCPGRAIDLPVSFGVIVSGGEIVHSIISPSTYVHSQTKTEDSAVTYGCRIDRSSCVVKTILDKNAVVEEGAVIGADLNHDHEHSFTVTESGITVVPEDTVVCKRV